MSDPRIASSTPFEARLLEMGLIDRMGAMKGGRLTLGACLGLAAATIAVGLTVMILTPLTPPDAAFAARTQAWRILGPTPR